MAYPTYSSSRPLELAELRARYVRLPEPVHFPASEEMPETNRHLELRTALYLLLKRELASRATIGSEQFVYYDPTTAKKSLAPDAFVKLGPPHEPFRLWKTWQRGAPDVAVEVVSDSDHRDADWSQKLERYQAAGIGEVVRFDPDDETQPLRVWDNVDGDLVERRRAEDGVYECGALGLFWVVVPHAALGRMLRLARDRAGSDLLPTHEEAEAAAWRAQHEEARARQEEARARQEEARARRGAEQAQHEAEQARDALAAEVAELRRALAASAKGKKRAPANAKKPRAKSAK
jgi:Uma2 family endonuclease